MPITTASTDDVGGTAGATGTGPGSSDATTGPSSADAETTLGVDPTMGSSSGLPAPCIAPEDCPNNETCSPMGECVSVCDAWGAGTYGTCLDDLGGVDVQGMCGPGHACIADAYLYETTACSVQWCATTCDCPAPPATGSAIVTCASITNGDASTDCYLSCENGETCPDGMECLVDSDGDPLLCATPVPPTLPVYGNCDDLAGVGCDGGTCGIFGGASVCTQACPGGAGDCDPAPPGARAPACGDVFAPPAGSECYLPCSGPGDCPSGMACVYVAGPGGACMW
jgi:hypothetical protein